MKKSHKIIIIILTVILIICCLILGWIISFGKNNTVNGEGENLTLACSKETIKKGDEVECSLKGNVSEYEVSALSSTLDLDTNLELIEITPDSSWEGDGEKGDIDLYTDINKKNKFKVLTFKVSLTNEDREEVQINLNENSFFDENYEEHKIENITTTLTVEK